MKREEYKIDTITVNDLLIDRVIIDPHVKKHPDITVNTIIALVKKLNGTINLPESTNDEFQYFAKLIILNDKQYRLVWLFEKNELYIGVITAHRDKRSNL